MLKPSDGSSGFRRPKASKSCSVMPNCSGIADQVLLDETGRETVESSRHCRVGREKVARPGDGQRNVEWLARLLHETAGAFQDCERGVPLIEVADLGPDP